MAVYKINDVDDARFIAEHFGFVPSNEGQRGAFPIRQLAKHLEQYGHTLDTSDYVSSAINRVDPSYFVTALVKIGEDENGTAVITPAYTQIALSEVREITGKTGRGRPGYMDIVNAAVEREHWTPVGHKHADYKVIQVNTNV
jgi:hypothetical protein